MSGLYDRQHADSFSWTFICAVWMNQIVTPEANLYI